VDDGIRDPGAPKVFFDQAQVPRIVFHYDEPERFHYLSFGVQANVGVRIGHDT
jgi:hypothetical protein